MLPVGGAHPMARVPARPSFTFTVAGSTGEARKRSRSLSATLRRAPVPPPSYWITAWRRSIRFRRLLKTFRPATKAWWSAASVSRSQGTRPVAISRCSYLRPRLKTEPSRR